MKNAECAPRGKYRDMPLSPEALHLNQPQFQLRPLEAISLTQKKEIELIYKESYGSIGLWIGDSVYSGLTIPTTTDIATVSMDGKIAACTNLNGKRAGIIAVNPECRNNGLVASLFNGLLSERPGSWISISIEEVARGILASATARDVPLKPVNRREEIVKLFEETKQTKLPKEYMFKEIEDEFLAKRLMRKGVNQNSFTVVSKTNSLHTSSYWQFVFQTSF